MASNVAARRGFLVREHRHSSPELPRPWIVLTPEVRTAALARPFTRHILPSHVGFFPDARGHRIRRESGIGSTIFKYCIRGTGWCELQGSRFEVGPGDLLVVPMGQPHAYGAHSERPWTIHWCHAMGDEVPHVLEELGASAERPVVRLGKSPTLVGLFAELGQVLADSCSAQAVLYGSQLLGHMLGLMIRLRREAAPEPPGARERVLESVAYMRAHPERPLDRETLASMAGLSSSPYTALFRTLTGNSPKHYFTRLRMTRARELLATTRDSVKAISYRLGFEDPLYFSRVFRLLNRMSPSRFRQLRRSDDRPY
jgi:AraC family transcriptional regulator, arabinose operon regulatory protein